MIRPGPKALVLATSYAPELRRPELRPAEHPRTDYVELARLIGCDIVDYSIYDSPRLWSRCRPFEKKLRMDLHLALTGLRRARDYDVVVLMSEMVAIPYMMFQRRARRRAATVYVSAHASQKQAKLVRSLRLFSGIDIAVGNTRAQREFFVNDMRIPDDRVRCVLYAADERFYTPSTSSGCSGGKYVFSTGIANRDYPTLIEAVRGLNVPVKLAMGGRFYSLDVRRDLPPVPENVEMLPPADCAGMRRLYQDAAVVVVPLQRDRGDATGCSVVLETGCSGRPVIASNTRGLRDYIQPGITGVFVPPGDPGALRNAITQTLSSDETAMGRAARAQCETRLSFECLVRGLASAAAEACGESLKEAA